MKKLLLLFAIAVLFVAASSSTSRTAGVTRIKVVKVDGGKTPEEVLATFNQMINDIMTTEFPNNPNWNDDDVIWGRDKQEIICSGMVHQVNGGGGVNIASGRFQHSGEFIEVLYDVIYP